MPQLRLRGKFEKEKNFKYAFPPRTDGNECKALFDYLKLPKTNGAFRSNVLTSAITA